MEDAIILVIMVAITMKKIKIDPVKDMMRKERAVLTKLLQEYLGIVKYIRARIKQIDKVSKDGNM